jgi:hypothetical protein
VHRASLGRDIEVVGDRRRLVEEFEPTWWSAGEAGADLDQWRSRHVGLAERNVELLGRDDHAAHQEVVEPRPRLHGEPADRAPVPARRGRRALAGRPVRECVAGFQQAPHRRRQQPEPLASADDAARDGLDGYGSAVGGRPSGDANCEMRIGQRTPRLQARDEREGRWQLQERHARGIGRRAHQLMHLLPVHDHGVTLGARQILGDELIEQAADLGRLEDGADGGWGWLWGRGGSETQAVGTRLPSILGNSSAGAAVAERVVRPHFVLHHQPRPSR